MGILWAIHGRPMGAPRESMDTPRTTHGRFGGNPWAYHGLQLTDNPRITYGCPTNDPRAPYVHSRVTHGHTFIHPTDNPFMNHGHPTGDPRTTHERPTDSPRSPRG